MILEPIDQMLLRCLPVVETVTQTLIDQFPWLPTQIQLPQHAKASLLMTSSDPPPSPLPMLPLRMTARGVRATVGPTLLLYQVQQAPDGHACTATSQRYSRRLTTTRPNRSYFSLLAAQKLNCIPASLRAYAVIQASQYLPLSFACTKQKRFFGFCCCHIIFLLEVASVSPFYVHFTAHDGFTSCTQSCHK